jgi:protein-tyrosine phosphatase
LNESLEMARIFEQAGYSHVVATPHAVPGTTWMPKPEEIQDKLAELNHTITENGIKLKVLPGMEIALDPNISDLLDQGQVQPLAGTSYVLIEPPFQRLPLGWDQAVFNVLSRGFSVLLAHPERCAQLSAKPQLCDELIESGVYFQSNWDSFLGHHGRTTQKMAMAENIEELMGPRNLQLISRENPIRVLRDEILESMERPKIQAIFKKRRKWRFWPQRGSKILAQG